MAYPTNPRIRKTPAKRPGKRKRSTIDASRVNPPPEIYVRVGTKDYWKSNYARAHLRNKHGYVYLAWRDGERIRELYLGKAPRKSPTYGIRRPAPGAAAGELLQELERRGKTKG